MKIVEMKFGSHLYGTNTPDSDTDLKGIYIPEGREIVLHTYKDVISTSRAKADCERNTKNDVDCEIFSLDRYLDLLMEGQTVALDMLFAPKDMWTGALPEGDYVMRTLYENREKLITRNIMAFVGYARQQASKYGIKGSRMDALKRAVEMLEPLPPNDRLHQHADKILALLGDTAKYVSLEKTPLVSQLEIPNPLGVQELFLEVCGRKIAFSATVKTAMTCYGKILAEYGSRAKKAHLDGGVDWKALSHAVRVNNEAIELLTTHQITFPRPEADFLLGIKQGHFHYDFVANCIEEGLAELTKVHASSTLPDKPDTKWAEDFIYEIYRKRVK